MVQDPEPPTPNKAEQPIRSPPPILSPVESQPNGLRTNRAVGNVDVAAGRIHPFELESVEHLTNVEVDPLGGHPPSPSFESLTGPSWPISHPLWASPCDYLGDTVPHIT